jgi:hypothetical protein
MPRSGLLVLEFGAFQPSGPRIGRPLTVIRFFDSSLVLGHFRLPYNPRGIVWSQKGKIIDNPPTGGQELKGKQFIFHGFIGRWIGNNVALAQM